ncbi:hypothetical protein WISP_124571 [Willisornis vidua]|uniref:Uncharacterized protein n=1 Tax=Willisornis vidua TaxID=1566151 RepID=A0ABQ9CRG5_9PASS|nr:hypothetical protein WISP_124571 [Willisornis vidua]
MNYLLSWQATFPGSGALHAINGMSTIVSNRDELGHESITPAKSTAHAMGSLQISALQQPDQAALEIKPRSDLAAPQGTASTLTFSMPCGYLQELLKDELLKA